MPNSPSVYQRYLWYLRLLTYNGFVVLADNHLNSDGTIVNAGVDTWVSVCTRAPHHPLAWADDPAGALQPWNMPKAAFRVTCMSLCYLQ